MRFKDVIIAMAIALTLIAPVCAASAENVALAVGEADIFASVPLCTYWYAQNERLSITPKMTVTNYGSSPIIVSQVRLPGSIPKPAGIPCEIMPSMKATFMLTANPSSLLIQKRAVKQAVIFTISKTGG
ncbi:MAG TPA: hypothetical protein PKB13_13385 [Clostridia bacterium]|nr:hypothetical protein [Clostridia bacterium]